MSIYKGDTLIAGGGGTTIVTLYDKDSADSSINKGYTNGITSGTSVSLNANSYKYLYITVQIIGYPSPDYSVTSATCMLDVDTSINYNVTGFTAPYRNGSGAYPNVAGCLITYRTTDLDITPRFAYNGSERTLSDCYIKKIVGVK